MTLFADIAFPTAIRRKFTYRIPDGLLTRNGVVSVAEDLPIRPGMRVWVPLKNQMAIGMVIHVHQNTPDFETRDIARILDKEPILSEELLRLTNWVHQFYYASHGEVIQAALPAGMNFTAESRVRLASGNHDIPSRGLEREIYDFIKEHNAGTEISLLDIGKKWRKKGERAVDRLAAKGLVEIWQIPKMRMKPQMETLWDWRDDLRQNIRENGIEIVLSQLLSGQPATEATTSSACNPATESTTRPAGNPATEIAIDTTENPAIDSAPDTADSPATKNVTKDSTENPATEATTRPAGNPATENTAIQPAPNLPKWILALHALADLPLPSTRKEIFSHPDITPYTWQRIRQTGFLISREVPAGRTGSRLPFDPERISTLNDSQKKIFEPICEAISNRTFKRFLLFGITGSGKTEIYIHALRETLEQGRGGLILVPEIALTPQTVRRFYHVFGDQIAVIHSRLSERERYDAWTSLQNGEKKVVIGARSAIFAPVHNPGLIIIDEEHDPSYKQEDPAPRYHARETAIMRALYNDAVILTGSATPSLVSLLAASTDKCTMLKLESRHALAVLPEVKILDLRQYRSAMRGPLAIPLFLAIEEALAKKEQVILLHNRRGFATFMQCHDCGTIVECPHCSVSLTYHKVKNHLRCHYCGYSSLIPRNCASCDSNEIAELGMGTQRVEEELAETLPAARILRMDQDTTSAKDAHDEILQRFARGDADILMGTQIVAKGLDFPNVTVVGVVNSDTELAFPSYRSSERMYQLLSQVAGRSGRGSRPGKVFLQTLMPDHTVLHFAQKHDFPGFARQEMKSRKELRYPPYSRLLKLFFKSADEQLVAGVAAIFTRIVEELLPGDLVMGPSPSSILRMKNTFSWESHIKLPPERGGKYIERLFNLAFDRYDARKPKSAGRVRITINVDTMH